MKVIFEPEEVFEKLDFLDFRLNEIRCNVPSASALVRITSDYESPTKKSHALFALLTYVSRLKIVQAELTVLVRDFERLKPDIIEILDETGDNAKKLANSTAFFAFSSELELLASQIRDRLYQTKTVIRTIDAGTSLQTQLERTLNSTSLIDFGRILNLTC